MATSYIYKGLSSASGTTATVSMWVKRLDGDGSAGDGGMIQFWSSGTNFCSVYANPTLKMRNFIAAGYSQGDITTNVKLRDGGAWTHVVAVWDTTNGTANDRMRIYINGQRITSFSSSSNPSSSYAFGPLESGNVYINRYNANTTTANHNYSHVHYCDGYAYEPTAFGETDATTGIWKIKTVPSVNYGTNGFFIFKDTGSITDESGNGHTFTTQGTITTTVDNPSNNFATWNTLMNNREDGIWLNGNTNITPNGDDTYLYAPTTIGVSSGKWYSEHMVTGGNGYGMLGAISEDNIIDGFRNQTGMGSLANSFAFRCRDGDIRIGDANVSYGSSPGTSDAIIGMALDMDNKKVWYSVNGTYVTYGGGVGNPGSGTYGFDISSLSGDTFFITCGDDTSSGYGNFKSNFGNGVFGTTAVTSAGNNASGNGIFEYDVPTGFTALSTKGLNL